MVMCLGFVGRRCEDESEEDSTADCEHQGLMSLFLLFSDIDTSQKSLYKRKSGL